MDAKINQVVMKPAKYNKEDELVHDEYAVLTLNIPMDSLTQKKEVMALSEVLSEEFVKVEITNPQERLNLE